LAKGAVLAAAKLRGAQWGPGGWGGGVYRQTDGWTYDPSSGWSYTGPGCAGGSCTTG
ncbi:DUF393 domain-containing protein, partial [Streptomyces sp. W16]|nr:DUF393 domain-containing protein [Streptomyces sp. W16]